MSTPVLESSKTAASVSKTAQGDGKKSKKPSSVASALSGAMSGAVVSAMTQVEGDGVGAAVGFNRVRPVVSRDSYCTAATSFCKAARPPHPSWSRSHASHCLNTMWHGTGCPL